MAAIENDATFVSPEGVYSLTEEYKPPPIHASTAGAAAAFHSKLTSVTVRFPAPKVGGGQGLTALLGGGKEKSSKEKEKDRKKGEESGEESDHDTPPGEDADLGGSADDVQQQQAALFSPTGLKAGPMPGGKRKSVSRPKHSIKTTSSSFVTRLHTMEGLSKHLAGKSGDVLFMFHNAGKSFYWMDGSSKVKVSLSLSVRSCRGVRLMCNMGRNRWRGYRSRSTRRVML